MKIRGARYTKVRTILRKIKKYGTLQPPDIMMLSLPDNRVPLCSRSRSQTRSFVVLVFQILVSANSGSAGRMEGRYGDSPQPEQLPTLPDEVWAIIFSKLVMDRWYHMFRLRTVCRQFARVADGWRSRVWKTVSFDFRDAPSNIVQPLYLGMAITCGRFVKSLELTGEHFVPGHGENIISISTVLEGLAQMPNLRVLNIGCCFGRDMSIIQALLQYRSLKHVSVTLLQLPDVDSTFQFTDESMDTLAELAVSTSVELKFLVSDQDLVDDLVDIILDKKGNLRSLQIQQSPLVIITRCATKYH